MAGDTPRERFVAAAARLFAERGYVGTSVADLQAACGLTAGSGALYKHFRSKQDLLAAVVDAHVATMRAGARWFATERPDDLGAALRQTAEAVVREIGRDRDAVRVMLRELDPFPELHERLWREIHADIYEPFAIWVAERVERDGLAVDDPYATAITLMAGLTSAPLLDALISRRPGELDPARFIDAWVHTARAALGDR